MKKEIFETMAGHSKANALFAKQLGETIGKKNANNADMGRAIQLAKIRFILNRIFNLKSVAVAEIKVYLRNKYLFDEQMSNAIICYVFPTNNLELDFEKLAIECDELARLLLKFANGCPEQIIIDENQCIGSKQMAFNLTVAS